MESLQLGKELTSKQQRTMSSSSLVKKSLPVVIRPPEPQLNTASATIDLHSFDRGLGSMPATCFLVFDSPIEEPVETIKRGLTRALVHYYPLAGRLAAGAGTGDLCIECNGEGVVFVEASADCPLKEAKFFESSSLAGATALPDDLAVYYPDAGFSLDDALLLMQVTVFSCGGFVVGVTWNHAVADGVGMAQFLRAVGELARGLAEPSVTPIRLDASLPGIPPTIAVAQQFMMGLEAPEFASFDYTVPWSLINRLKTEFRGDHGDGEPCTVFEAVTAVLWQCRTRVVIADPEAPALLFVVANVRKHVGAKEGYYGNCVSGQLVMAPSATVANGDITDLIKLIKGAKKRIPKQLMTENDGGDDRQPQAEGRGRHEDMLRYNYNILSVSSMRNIGMDDADFGRGRAARVMCRARTPHITVPSSVVCLPWSGKDGANLLARCVREEHVDALLGELARFT